MEKEIFNAELRVFNVRKKQGNDFPHSVDIINVHKDGGVTRVAGTYYNRKRLPNGTVIKYKTVRYREYPGKGKYQGQTMREIIDYTM